MVAGTIGFVFKARSQVVVTGGRGKVAGNLLVRDFAPLYSDSEELI
jgi:hypothetical protein